jgi:ribosomal protein S18 acetylase RimI-like enzyme
MLEIRTLTVADADQYIALRRLALASDPSSFAYTPEEDPNLKIEVVRKRLSAADTADGPFVIGALDPELVGVIGVIRESDDTARLWWMYVQPAGRGKGTGRLLLRESLQLARGLPGVKTIVLSVARTAEAAIRLYASEGFRTSKEDEVSLEMTLEGA